MGSSENPEELYNTTLPFFKKSLNKGVNKKILYFLSFSILIEDKNLIFVHFIFNHYRLLFTVYRIRFTGYFLLFTAYGLPFPFVVYCLLFIIYRIYAVLFHPFKGLNDFDFVIRFDVGQFDVIADID